MPVAMSFCALKQLQKIILPCLQQSKQLFFVSCVRDYTIFNSNRNKLKFSKFEIICPPLLPYQNPTRGMKDRDVLTKRCKDCYFQRVDGRWYVFCNTYPRHKQRQKLDEKSKWIITHSTHGVKKF